MTNKINEDWFRPVILLKKWVDYTKKYGLGYQLTDQSTGVYFNDKTSMVDLTGQQSLTFIER